MSRPSMNQASRPSGGVRPNVGARPGGGNFHPSGGRPNFSPGARPGSGNIANRPSVRPPSNVGPTTRPSFPSGGLASANRPNIGNRPGGGNLPGTGGNRPNIGGNRPTTLPGNVGRPGGGNRPSIPGSRPGQPGGGNRPSIPGNRPGTPGDRPGIGNLPGRPGGGNRPSIPGNRPGVPGDRPGIGNRPGRPGDRPGIGDRPSIGGNRPGRPGGNINIGNDVNIGGGNIGIGNIGGGNVGIGNRPGWDRPNWNNPGWGWGGGWGGNGWAGNWHNHCINPHYGWYNGCWNNYWGSNWYRPLAWGAVGWGLGSMTSGWGYGGGYYNPYYTSAVAASPAPYDYSQPIVVNTYSSDVNSGDGGASAPIDSPPADPAAAQATKLFDEGLALFKSGDYRGSLAKFDAALAKLPGDPVVHEVRALALFALGDYKQAAAALNSLLSSAPGMDWTTMSSLYGNTDDYQKQLDKLHDFTEANPNDSAAHFVLAYHALVLGDKQSAIDALKVVVANQPKDATAKRMLDALAPANATPKPATPAAPDAAPAPEIDLVGLWRAKADGTQIDLKITEDSQFQWKAATDGKPPVELKGTLASTADELEFASEGQGSMAGAVKPLGPDKWQFSLAGAPPTAPGLTFERVKK
ncbi:MAG: tetratricopeptide repeat protein [Pirellulales bacterium]|nr:tetratricopeptide repeat protein [Pirellulales bacterium]